MIALVQVRVVSGASAITLTVAEARELLNFLMRALPPAPATTKPTKKN